MHKPTASPIFSCADERTGLLKTGAWTLASRYTDKGACAHRSAAFIRFNVIPFNTGERIPWTFSSS